MDDGTKWAALTISDPADVGFLQHNILRRLNFFIIIFFYYLFFTKDVMSS